MRTRVWLVAVGCTAALVGTAAPAFAHRLDEYLEAATISVSRERIVLRLRLTAGVAAAQKVIGAIDTDGDGIISGAEQRSYADNVRNDLTLRADGHDVPLTLVASSFAPESEIRQGLGDIVLTFTGPLPPGGATRRLTFANHHQPRIGAYLVNTLVPEDPAIHVLAQDRSRDQSFYQLDLEDGVSAGTASAPDAQASFERGNTLDLVRTYFWHGVAHILTGFDHLLFLAALVLGAATLWELVKVVTAFTIAHSITLTLAALGLVHLPAGVVEPVIAASIVFVAAQNVFWPEQSHGRSRLLVAFSFGLFHGLGFAGGLLEIMHQMPPATILLAILGFSLGVEAGNQMVLLPFFGMLTLARRIRSRDLTRLRALPILNRLGSAAVSVAGLYYLCCALACAL